MSDSTPPATTVTKDARISLGILGTMIMSAVGGSAYLSSMKTSVDNVVESVRQNTLTLKEVKVAVQEDSKVLAVLRSEFRLLEERVKRLEKQ
jgi:hypothetical protein